MNFQRPECLIYTNGKMKEIRDLKEEIKMLQSYLGLVELYNEIRITSGCVSLSDGFVKELPVIPEAGDIGRLVDKILRTTPSLGTQQRVHSMAGQLSEKLKAGERSVSMQKTIADFLEYISEKSGII